MFALSATRRQSLGLTQPPIPRLLGIFLPGLKRPQREFGHSRPSRTEVKKEWSYIFNPPYNVIFTFISLYVMLIAVGPITFYAQINL
jgi:hypothetical protein